jgi:hypothetical protein
MRRVTYRYPYSSALFRYAMAAALNGQPKAALDTISVLCKIHSKTHCDEGRKAWFTLAEELYPELRNIAWPVTPVSLSQ